MCLWAAWLECLQLGLWRRVELLGATGGFAFQGLGLEARSIEVCCLGCRVSRVWFEGLLGGGGGGVGVCGMASAELECHCSE